MVRNGLVQAVIGVERLDEMSMQKLDKKNNNAIINTQAFGILRKKYPQVYTIATLIYGMPEDNWKELLRINKMIHSNFADMVFMMPFTPYPGTKVWNDYKHSIKEVDLRKFNLHLPVMGTNHITKEKLNLWFKLSLLDYVLFRPGNFLRRVMFENDQRKRNIQLSLAKKIFKLGTVHLLNKVTRKQGYELEYGIKPEWYDT
jgi:radical SAM superfamily enzyme YgiQ (UPF0313 family)